MYNRSDKKIKISLLTLSLFLSCASHAESTLNTSNKSNPKNLAMDQLSLTESAQMQLKHLGRTLAVDASASQPDHVKDPFQPLNRKIYVFNNALDSHILRPIAVQYKEKFPSEVRGSYRSFRNNLGEPWNATNQIIQWKPLKALKTLGRFTLNTLTTLGLADPAQRLSLSYEDESLGTTLGYYHVPSGPYIMLPFLGPSTLRDSLGWVVDRQARPQKYIFEDHDGLYWTDTALGAIDLRSSFLDVDGTLQGDKYAALRDAYLQRNKFVIAEKQGNPDEGVSFVDDTNSP
ncbi:MlaA family lipoprotein [Acinetobacter rathckeae]|uniref:MlaA family lipoprotein n=1 Tax=Acinetobacter rathckeae TaxID=2605272 RepID=UPI0018A32FCC|nr:VacJ family lipoprotein [Acinetobacter rathckeae]MBF7696603.1 VacJ family lipoprotein [Acinetobacter rathckeae]